MAIPSELKNYRQWVVWKYETVERSSKQTKVPYNAVTFNDKASTTNPTTWCSYEQAVAARDCTDSPFDGIGFVLTKNDPFCFIDLDATSSEAEQKEQQKIREQLSNTYAETSVSGKGTHIICRATLDYGIHYSHIEMYDTQRYMTMSGNQCSATDAINDYQDKVTELFRDLESFQKNTKPKEFIRQDPEQYSDEQIIQWTMNGEGGDKFRQLFFAYPDPQKRHPTGDGSDSSADQAIINTLWARCHNIAQTERIWRMTPLGQRDKALRRQRYVDNTILKASDRDIVLVPHNIQPVLSATVLPPSGFTMEWPDDESDKDADLPLPPGMLGELALYFYSQSRLPHKAMAICTALAWMAGVCGRAYNVGGTGVNLFLMLLANSGAGKNAMHQGISGLTQHIGDSAISLGSFFNVAYAASGQGLYGHLETQPAFLMKIPEFSGEFYRWTAKNAGTNEKMLKTAITNLYSASGKKGEIGGSVFSDKTKNKPGIKSPAMSILGESTPDSMFELMTPALLRDGTLNRFIFFQIVKSPDEPNDAHEWVVPSAELSFKVVSLLSSVQAATNQKQPIDVIIDANTRKVLRDYEVSLRRAHNNENADPAVRDIWVRAVENTMRVAALVAIGCNCYAPALTVEHFEWARHIVETSCQLLHKRFVEGVANSEDVDTAGYEMLLKFLRKFVTAVHRNQAPPMPKYIEANDVKNLVVTWSYLRQNLIRYSCFSKHPRGSINALQSAIRIAQETGVLSIGIGPGVKKYQIFAKLLDS